jgi:hypothetical protein
MLLSQMLVSMTDLITSVSLQPPSGGGMNGTTTTPLMAPPNLLLALIQADVYPCTPTFASRETEPTKMTVPSGTVMFFEIFRKRSISSSMVPESKRMIERQ